VLCGPGNNGGDGFVVANELAAHGWPVTVAATRPVADYAGAAGAHARRWRGAVQTVSPAALDGVRLVVDALFGAGLNRPIDGAVAATLRAAQRAQLPIVAIDVPSGVHGDTGAVHGMAVPACLTVSFFRAKPGHYLIPGRALCGELVIRRHRYSGRRARAIRPRVRRNAPALWRDAAAAAARGRPQVRTAATCWWSAAR